MLRSAIRQKHVVVSKVRPRPIRFCFASGEAEANAARRRLGGEPRLVSPFPQLCLASVPIKCTSGASGYRRDSPLSVGASKLDAVIPTPGQSSGLFSIGMFCCRARRSRARCLSVGFANIQNNWLPTTHSLQHAVGMFDRVHMTIMVFDHLDRRSHLLGEEINVDTFAQAERGIGVAEAISRARNAVGAFPQTCLNQQC